MKWNLCEYCNGRLTRRRVTESYSWEGALVIIEGVPVRVCHGCGERYYPAGVIDPMQKIARNRGKIRRKITIPVARFGA